MSHRKTKNINNFTVREHIGGSSFTFEELKNKSVSQRPKMLGPSFKKIYFVQNSFFPFWLPVILIILNGVMIALRNGEKTTDYLKSFGFLIITGAPILIAHLSIKSGYISSNIGTYIREKEPFRYWIDIVFLYSISIFFNVLAYIKGF